MTQKERDQFSRVFFNIVNAKQLPPRSAFFGDADSYVIEINNEDYELFAPILHSPVERKYNFGTTIYSIQGLVCSCHSEHYKTATGQEKMILVFPDYQQFVKDMGTLAEYLTWFMHFNRKIRLDHALEKLKRRNSMREESNG